MTVNVSRFLRAAILTLAVQIFCFGTAYGQTKIVRSGLTVLSTSSPQGKAKVSIRTVIFNRSCACSCPAARALKELELKEMSVTEKLNISVGGKSIFAPDSVYDHLFEPHDASLKIEGREFVLRIDGQDASNSYFVLVYFNRTGVHRYVTFSSLVPDKPTSDTHYFQVGVR